MADYTSDHEIRTTLSCVKEYIEYCDWVLCSIPRGSKGPIKDNWNKSENCIWTVDQAKACWPSSSTSGVGVVLSHSGVVALDIDDVELTRAVFDTLGQDLDALLKYTTRLKGNPEREKLFFLQPENVELSTHKLAFPSGANGSTKRKTVFELRAGHVQDCLPPTIHPGTKKPYFWVNNPLDVPPAPLPPWLLELWTKWGSYKDHLCPWVEPQVKPPKRQDAQNINVIAAFNQQNDVRAILERHGYRRKGKRYLAPDSESGLPGVVILKNGNVYSHHGADPLADEHAHDAFDLYRILDHGGDWKAATKAAAKELGITPHNVISVPEWLDADPVYEPEPNEVEPPYPPEVEPPAPFFDMDAMRVNKWMDSEPKPRQWILRNIMPTGKTGMLVAPGGTGKSQMIMQLAISVATGVPLFGRYEIDNPGGVLAFFAEDDNEELHRRFRNSIDALINSPELYVDQEQFQRDLRKNLFIASMVGRDVRITRSGPDGPMLTQNFDSFLATVQQIPDLRIMMLDPIIRFLSGDPNDAIESTRVVQAGERLSQATGAFVLWANHTNKQSMRAGGDSMGQEASRGSSALTDGMRWQMNLATMDKRGAKDHGIKTRERGYYVQVCVPKNNYAPPFAPIWLRRGQGGYLDWVELHEKSDPDATQILEQAIGIIKTRGQAGDEYSKTQFCHRFGGMAGELGCGIKRVQAIIGQGIDDGQIIEREPKNKKRNVVLVLGIPDPA